MTADWPDSPIGGELGDGRFAHATDRPATVDGLGESVARRVAEGHAIYPRGGGTALDHGGVPARPGVAVDLRMLNRVVDYPIADMTITVEAGITLGTLRATLAGQGQRFPLDAPRADRATLGGIYATAASGPRRFGLGRARDHIIGVRYVDARGDILKGGGRVVKNVAGYDLPKLLTGSLGTLGIIAELTLKVRPMPEASALSWIPFAGLLDASEAVDRLNTSGTRPVAVELLDATAAGRVGGAVGLPADGWVVIVGFEDNAESVAWQVDRLASELGRSDFAVLRDDDTSPIWSGLVDAQAADDAPLTILVNLRPSSALKYLAALDPGRWEVRAHAGSGIIRAHLLAGAELGPIAAEIDLLRDGAVRLGGNLTLPRCPTAWKDRLRVWGHPRADWAMAAKVKAALDPSGALNPGRFVGTI